MDTLLYQSAAPTEGQPTGIEYASGWAAVGGATGVPVMTKVGIQPPAAVFSKPTSAAPSPPAVFIP